MVPRKPQQPKQPKRATVGISPKVIAALLTSLATLLLTKLALPWNPIVEQAINAVAPLIAAWLAPPANTKVVR